MNLEKTSVPAPNAAAPSGQGKLSKGLQRENSTSLQPDIAQTAAKIRESRRRRQSFQRNLGVVLVLVLIGLYLLSLMVGKTFISLSDIWRILNGENLGGANFALLEIRLPRATLAVLAGIAYGISGYIFQTLLRNQLASPDIIGISAGASAAGVAGIVLLGLSQTGVSLMALAGALAAAILIYLLAFKGGFSGTRMILLGIGVSSMLMSFVTYILSRAERWDLSTASRWLTGSLNGASWARILPLIVVVTLFVPLLLILRAKLGVLQLGDE
ncbi:MAG: iron chelate uptake ABC transporter family permease subunit, partial [Arcanobacterium sp.]|nr:iron chelate uptake ABC transporter family permease subunit [Arcanobacterium sp.]